ncbi:hypothetical protein BJ546DRAFT_135187 [Cryomyces antarcticus]
MCTPAFVGGRQGFLRAVPGRRESATPRGDSLFTFSATHRRQELPYCRPFDTFAAGAPRSQHSSHRGEGGGSFGSFHISPLSRSPISSTSTPLPSRLHPGLSPSLARKSSAHTAPNTKGKARLLCIDAGDMMQALGIHDGEYWIGVALSAVV